MIPKRSRTNWDRPRGKRRFFFDVKCLVLPPLLAISLFSMIRLALTGQVGSVSSGPAYAGANPSVQNHIACTGQSPSPAFTDALRVHSLFALQPRRNWHTLPAFPSPRRPPSSRPHRPYRLQNRVASSPSNSSQQALVRKTEHSVPCAHGFPAQFNASARSFFLPLSSLLPLCSSNQLPAFVCLL